jgi:hypothetical protein
MQANWSGYTTVSVTTIFGGEPATNVRRISYYKGQTFDPWAYAISAKKPFHVSITAVPVAARDVPPDDVHRLDCQVLIEWQQLGGARPKLPPIATIDSDTKPGGTNQIGCGTSITRIPAPSRNGD